MSFTRFSVALLAATISWPVAAQSAVPVSGAMSPGGDPPIAVSATLRPALDQVGNSLGSLTIRRWKAPGEVKSAADQDVSSIQRDLSGTLAGLLQQADAAPGSLPAAFAVYRNVDALYDTLLRVVLTANLAAPDEEANALQAALTSLETARSSLGDSILNASQAQQTELVRIRTAMTRAPAVQHPAVTTTVIDDGPAESRPKHKAATTKKPATSSSKPATSSPQQ